MNNKAREALVSAAMNGVKQVKGAFFKGDGMCAMGVIHRAYAKEVGINYSSLPEDWITKAEAREVLHANDNLGWDFLTIARKIGNQEEVY